MNSLEAQLDYPLAARLPGAGLALEVAPGIKWLRLPLPFALDHINLWLLRDEIDDVEQSGGKRQGWCVVDCGIHSSTAKAQWEAIFASQLEGLPILRVIVTHMHPDHIGLAHWLCQRWSTPTHHCAMWISATDYQTAQLGVQSADAFGGAAALRFYRAHGVCDSQQLASMAARTDYYRRLVPALPESYCRLLDGNVLRIGKHDWRCISGYGHAPEHIALHCAQLCTLISGDMALPSISTNISVYAVEPEGNPLALFLASIDKFLPLDGNTLTLPAHGRPFRGLATRIEQLHRHHQERLSEVLQACAAQPCSASDIMLCMFKRELDLHQTSFAIGEAIAHLNLLLFDGRLQRHQDSAGIYRFRPT